MTTFGLQSKKRVSFVLVTKNKGVNLEETLKRAKSLLGREDELVIVDGGSEDSTVHIVQKYKDFVDVFVSEPDMHAMHAHNKAILLSSGKYIKLLTDNDIFYKDGIEKSVDIMEKNPNIDLLLCGGTKEYNGRKRAVCVPQGVNYGKSPKDAFLYKGADTGVGHFARRSVFAKVGLVGFNTNSDKEFVLRCIAGGCNVKFARVNLYHHILASDSLVIRKAQEHANDTLRLAKIYCGSSFYWKYKLGTMFKNGKLLKPFYIIYLGFIRRFTKPSLKKEPTWDGGFS